MDLTPDQIDEIESLIARLESVDPADLPEPAARLVDLLNELLEPEDDT